MQDPYDETKEEVLGIRYLLSTNEHVYDLGFPTKEQSILKKKVQYLTKKKLIKFCEKHSIYHKWGVSLSYVKAMNKTNLLNMIVSYVLRSEVRLETDLLSYS